MKKIIFLLVIMFVLSPAMIQLGGAPNSGDGNPDGPGWSEDNPKPGELGGKGPAPNSGDGIPDGSGF